MSIKKYFEERIRGWFPQEPCPSNGTRFRASISWSKVLRFSIVFGVLALILALTIIYLPFINGYAALLTIAIANIVAAYLVHKGVLPKPSTQQRLRNLAILAIVLIVTLIVWVLSRGF